MRNAVHAGFALAVLFLVSVAHGQQEAPSQAQTPAPAASAKTAAPTDVYHVMFVKATPGQAGALEKELRQPDPKDPSAGRMLILRHAEGDDWDYATIAHIGAKAAVEVGAPPAQPATPTRAWHSDTFVAGPSWAEFERAMGLKDAPAAPVYLVGIHRAVPGQRDQLLKLLNETDPDSKVPTGHVTLVHLEGGPWNFLSLDRFNSWQDFAADRAANPSGSEGWQELRRHSASHHDTLAERVK